MDEEKYIFSIESLTSLHFILNRSGFAVIEFFLPVKNRHNNEIPFPKICLRILLQCSTLIILSGGPGTSIAFSAQPQKASSVPRFSLPERTASPGVGLVFRAGGPDLLTQARHAAISAAPTQHTPEYLARVTLTLLRGKGVKVAAPREFISVMVL